MKNWTDIIKNMTMLTQFGLSFVTPIFLCLALCWWLNIHVGIGAWVYIPGFFFGLPRAWSARPSAGSTPRRTRELRTLPCWNPHAGL